MKVWTCHACLYERIAVMMNCSNSGLALEVALSIRRAVTKERSSKPRITFPR